MVLLRSSRKGFTLIEVLVAIAVITTISFAPFAIIAQRLIDNSLAEDRVRAHLMAQEVIEFVHFARDQSIIDADEKNWFANLRNTNASENIYAPCVVSAEDFIKGSVSTYCSVQCRSTGVASDCTGSNGFVSGINSSAGTQGNAATTCDGGSVKADGAFTVTLNIVIPEADADVQYALIDSCVSWQGADDVVRSITSRETMFEWVLKT
ncbi:MAG: prepilin-type N-terminal cleavage/methylation domain-containing protein [Candidatus Kaiserbacteria bacterium]|nr:prepilin-type N-terminal cleavage/methylation domain-containing protein [Candidatus Kaiserbacteria bacterium]